MSVHFQIFAGRLLLSRLQTIDELAKRGLISGMHKLGCPLCLCENETHYHLFIVCHVAKEVWSFIFDWVQVEGNFYFPAVSNHLLWFASAMLARTRKNCRVLIWLSVVREIRLIENDILFNGGCKGVRRLLS